MAADYALGGRRRRHHATMKTNHVRQKLKAGEATVGCFLGMGSPNVAEQMAHSGFDFIVIEMEHNGLDMAEVQHMLMAINGTDTIPIVRIPSSDQVFIQRSLDIGALGIIVPLLRSADQAREVVRATRYPPDGIRGFGPLRASHYTLDYPDYLGRANDNILVSFLLETARSDGETWRRSPRCRGWTRCTWACGTCT